MLRALLNWLRSAFARYEGATFSTSRSVLSAPYQSARFDAGQSTRRTLQAKARYFERNNAILNRMADLFECYTVGPDLVVQPASSDPTYNTNAKLALDSFFQFGDIASLAGLSSLFSLAARTWFIDGEVFILKVKGQGGRPRLQLVEAHRVATPSERSQFEGRSVVDGVEIDPNGRPIGYWIGTEDEKGKLVFDGLTPAASVFHLFEPSRVGQYRGLPMIYPVINELHDLDDLHLLEMQAAKEAAAVTNVIKNKAGEINPATAIRNAYTRGTTTNTNTAATETTAEYYQQVLGARTIALKNGEDISQFRGERPSVVTQQYWRYKTELVCSGVGIPYVLVFPESMQGTVYRGALDSADAFFRSRHAVLANIIRQVCRWALMWEKSNNPALRDAPGDWDALTIHCPRSVNVDVGWNSQAALQELAAGITTYDLLYAPRGLDWREQFDRLKEQQAYAKEIGLALVSGQPGQAQMNQGQAGNPAQTDPAYSNP